MVKKSGIPELRRFCRKITASAQLLQALNFMRSKLPSLLNSIKIWTESINVAAQIHNDVTERSVLDHYERSKEEVTDQTIHWPIPFTKLRIGHCVGYKTSWGVQKCLTK